VRTALIFFSLLGVPTFLFSDTIHVPGDHPTIQEAIDAAVNGDTVLVAAGTYVENIDFLGKAITVKSSDGPESTIIDGGNPPNPDFKSVVTFNDGEGLDSVLEGFTLANGVGAYIEIPIGWAYCGGGVYCGGSSPTITGNRIVNNSGYGGVGGGIHCNNSSPTIKNNTIAFNGQFIGQGGGIGCWYDSSPLIMNNVIIMNEAYCTGGGIDCFLSSPTITNNTVALNYSPFTGSDVSLTCYYSVITNNIIWNDSNGALFVEGPQGIQYCNVSGGYPGVGNIDADPLFVNPANGDFHLMFNSPCRGSGNNVG